MDQHLRHVNIFESPCDWNESTITEIHDNDVQLACLDQASTIAGISICVETSALDEDVDWQLRGFGRSTWGPDIQEQAIFAHMARWRSLLGAKTVWAKRVCINSVLLR